jgi:hypothetical protein
VLFSWQQSSWFGQGLSLLQYFVLLGELIPYRAMRAPELLLVFAAGLHLYGVRSGFCAQVFSAAKDSSICDLTRIFVLCSGAVQIKDFYSLLSMGF